MKKGLKMVSASLLLLGVLSACNSEEAPAEEVDQAEEQTEETEEQSDVVTSADELEDQVDLRIGDTAKVASNIGTYEITIDSVRFEDEVNGEQSQLDYHMIVDLSVKNIGENVIDANEGIDILENTSNLEGSGFSDLSQHYEDIDTLSGELQPGEEKSGQAIFSVHDRDEQYIRVRGGLLAAGGVYTNAIWTIEKSEVE